MNICNNTEADIELLFEGASLTVSSGSSAQFICPESKQDLPQNLTHKIDRALS
jgi:hypothetical protein